MFIRPAVRRGDTIPLFLGGSRRAAAVVVGPHPRGALVILPQYGATFPLGSVVWEETQ